MQKNDIVKVLQLGKFYPVIGGVEKVMLDLTRGLSERGIRCDMLCANHKRGESSFSLELNANARIFCMKTLTKKMATMISPSMVLKLHQIASQYDIIHIHHPDPMAAVALLLSDYKGKVILHWHSDILKQRCALKLYSPIQSWLIRRADLIVGTTPVYVASSPYLVNVQNKCTYLPIGIEGLKWNQQRADEIKSKFVGKKIIFSLGRLVGYKGFKYLIDSANFLSDDYVILIGGSGELFEELSRQIVASHLQNKVILLGRVLDEDLPNYYAACDLFCLSSIQKTEAFAIVQVEAMSCHKPIVATKIPGSGVSWVNAQGVSGENVPLADSRSLAHAFERILMDKECYTKYSNGAYCRYFDNFRLDSMIDKCLGIYHKVLED